VTPRIVARATHHPGETSADVRVPGDGTSRIWWRSPNVGKPNDNFLLPLTLLVAMRTGYDVFHRGPPLSGHAGAGVRHSGVAAPMGPKPGCRAGDHVG